MSESKSLRTSFYKMLTYRKAQKCFLQETLNSVKTFTKGSSSNFTSSIMTNDFKQINFPSPEIIGKPYFDYVRGIGVK